MAGGPAQRQASRGAAGDNGTGGAHLVDSERRRALAEVVEGLSRPLKALPSRLFYDERGSQLFERITELDEYYLTRTEMAIMREHAAEMARALGAGCLLIEYGAGSCTKTRFLLDHLPGPAGYIPVDVSASYLEHVAADLRAEYPGLPVLPVAADFTEPFQVPHPPRPERRRAVYFPGSTIGNFEHATALRLLRQMAEMAGRGGYVLLGIDMDKDPAVLDAAYNDSKGVTAEFNLNLLAHVNRLLGANFDLAAFTHRAICNRQLRRIEMYLDSLRDQTVSVDGRQFKIGRGEPVLTEYSHKYTPESFASMAGQAGLAPRCTWTDDAGMFSVVLLTATARLA